MKLKMRGIGAMQDKLRDIIRTQPQRVAAALYHEAEVEVTEMKRLCPVDITPNAPHPGNLRNSIHAEPPEIHGNKVSVTVATGAQAPYAIYVHEDPDAIHPIGQWKFMEQPLKESAPYIADRVAARIHVDKK